MNPEPLKDQSGATRAWICGACGCIGEFNGETSERHVEESHRAATQ